MRNTILLVVFSVIGGKLRVYSPDGILPRGTIGMAENLDSAATDIFSSSLSLDSGGCYFEQLFSIILEENSMKELAVVYFFLYPQHLIPEGREGEWHAAENGNFKAQEADITAYAVQRLRWKIEYTNVVYGLLPHEFTLSELQGVYEAILDRRLDKRNFRKKILTLRILSSANRKKKTGSARPAELFAFKNRSLSYVKVL